MNQNRMVDQSTGSPMTTLAEFVLPKITQDWLQAINVLMQTRPSSTCCLGNRVIDYRWGLVPYVNMTIYAIFENQGHRWALGLDSLKVFDERLTGEPFMSLSVDLRTLCVEKLVNDFTVELPASFRNNLEIISLNWDASNWPKDWHEIPIALRNIERATVSNALLAFESPTALTWLLECLPKPEIQTLPSLTAQINQHLRIEVGTTYLTSQQIKDLARNDLVWVESAHISANGLVSQLRVLRRINSSQLINDSTCFFGFLKQRRWHAEPALETRVAQFVKARMTDTTKVPMMNIDDLELPVTFDLGEIQMTLAEIEKLSELQVLELTQEATSASVQLRVHGTCIARGSLMVVGRRLAVRLEKIGIAKDSVLLQQATNSDD
jgi:flagellar motor switch/type III secretory pathway protein FliN